MIRNHLRASREGLGLTQSDLADALGVSRQTIVSLEKGRYFPSLELTLRLAKYFGVPVEALFQLEEDSQAS